MKKQTAQSCNTLRRKKQYGQKKLLDYGKIQRQHDAGRVIGEIVLIAKEGHVVAEFVEVAFIANVGGKAARTDSQTRLPAPGELFPAFGITVHIR